MTRSRRSGRSLHFGSPRDEWRVADDPEGPDGAPTDTGATGAAGGDEAEIAPTGEPLAQVRVPASAANLGPGFDVLAAALDLPLHVSAYRDDGRRVVVGGEGAGELPCDDGNLVWQGLAAFCDVFGDDVPDVTLVCDNHIPLQRGLGSSAAATVAGLVLGRALTGATVADQDIVDLAGQLEGHADNAAAALLGGLVVAAPAERALRFEPARSLRPVVCVPGTRSATRASRALLPTSVPLTDVVATARRTALVLAGLSGAAVWDPSTMVDTVHEPPRFAAMQGSAELVGALRDAGFGACLSGAGPSVLAVVPADDPSAIARITELADADWTAHAVDWDRAGAATTDMVATP